MNKINIGSGPDIKDGWVNSDLVPLPGIELWDLRWRPRDAWIEAFDKALINHTLCLLSYEEAETALGYIKNILRPGGELEVIDVDVNNMYRNYKNNEPEIFVGLSGTIDELFCKSLVGYGRKSLYTAQSMMEMVERAGFHDIKSLRKSENDSRPKESLIVKAKK